MTRPHCPGSAATVSPQTVLTEGQTHSFLFQKVPIGSRPQQTIFTECCHPGLPSSTWSLGLWAPRRGVIPQSLGFSVTPCFPPVKGDSGATCDIMARRRTDVLMRAGEERGTLEGMWHGRKNRGHSLDVWVWGHWTI